MSLGASILVGIVSVLLIAQLATGVAYGAFWTLFPKRKKQPFYFWSSIIIQIAFIGFIIYTDLAIIP